MNPTTMSRTELVHVLLGNGTEPEQPSITHVSDAPARYPLSQQEPCSLLERKLSAARELLLRDLRATLCTGSVFQSPHAVHEWLRLHCAQLEHEVFMVLYLNVQNQMIDIEEMFRGTLTQTSVYPREIVKSAIQHNAADIVFAHNHPSGNIHPSRADEALTQTLKAALALVDVRVLDHFIVAGEHTVSFAERGLI